MPKFFNSKDLDFIKTISEEVVDYVVEQAVTLFKVSVGETKTNLYGESLGKVWRAPSTIMAIVDREPMNVVYEGFGADSSQTVEFRFNRITLEDTGFYPEDGDIIFHNNGYFEIDNVREDQLIGGQSGEKFSIICSTFMTRRSSIQTEMRVI